MQIDDFDPSSGQTDSTTEPRARAVKSVEHALAILEFLASDHKAAGVTQMASQLGMNASTVHHLLKTLQSRQLVEQNPESKLYRLGVRCIQLGDAYLAGVDLYAIAQPFLREAAQECGETVTLAALDGVTVVTLSTIPGRFTVRSLGATTDRHNAHATALGKILLAGLASDELRDFVAEAGLTRFTANTIGSFRQLESELKLVREQGYALDQEELETGLSCAAVGILNHRHDRSAAIGVSVPTHRFTEERRAMLIDIVRAAALKVSARLGYEPDGPTVTDGKSRNASGRGS